MLTNRPFVLSAGSVIMIVAFATVLSLAGCQSSSGGAGPAGPTTTELPKPQNPSPSAPTEDSLIYKFADGHQAFIRPDESAVLLPAGLSAEIVLENPNANIGWFTQNEGSTWREKCVFYQELSAATIQDYRDALSSGDTSAGEIKKILESVLEEGTLVVGSMRLKFQAESEGQIQNFVSTQWPLALKKPNLIRAPKSNELILDVKNSSAGHDSLVVLSGKLGSFGRIVRGSTPATMNEYCDVLLGTTKYSVQFLTLGSGVEISVVESSEGVRPKLLAPRARSVEKLPSAE